MGSRRLASFSLASISGASSRKTSMAMLALFSKSQNYTSLCRITRSFEFVSAPLYRIPLKSPFQGNSFHFFSFLLNWLFFRWLLVVRFFFFLPVRLIGYSSKQLYAFVYLVSSNFVLSCRNMIRKGSLRMNKEMGLKK